MQWLAKLALHINVSILPSAKGFASRLQREIGSDLARAGKAGGEDYGKGFEKSAVVEAGSSKVSSGIGDKLKVGLAAAGALAGVALVAGIGEALNRGQLDAKLSAQLGSGPRTKRATKVAADLFRGAWGDSVEDVNNAVASVVTNIGGMRQASQRELKGVTASVLDIATAFDQDASAITRAADQLVRTDLAKGPREALDIITRGFQSGANEADDLLDTYSEYGTQFRKLGFDGAQATGLLTQGLRAGARDADVVADAFKEFSIRAIDDSELTSKSFDALGLSADDMEDKIARGGQSAADATALVLDKLRGVRDPAERAQIAVGLFGTQAEDLGDSLFALDPSKAVRTLGEVGGAARRMGKTLNDNAATRVEEFKRTLQSDFVDFLGQEVIPKADALYSAWKDLPAPIRTVTKALGGFAGIGLAGTFLGAKFIGAVGSAKTAIGGFRTSVASAGDAATTSRGKLSRFGGFLGAGGPWGLALAAGVTGLGFFLKAQADAEQKVQNLTSSLNKQTGAVTRNTAQQVINAAQEEGLYARAAKVGISAEQLTRALLGQGDAFALVNRRLNATIKGNSEWQSTGLTSSKVATGVGRDAVQLSAALHNQSGVLADATSKWKQNKNAQQLTNRVLGQTQDLWQDDTEATRENTRISEAHRRQLGQVAEQLGFNQRETRRLIRDYGDVPGKVDTEAIFRTADAARARDSFLTQTKGKFSDLGNDTYAIMVNGQSGHGRIFAGGGFFERHDAQIAKPGTPRVWAEPETGGEAYIPLASSKRGRSLDIWAETGRRLGVQGFADGGITGRVNTKVNMDLSALRETVNRLVKSLKSAGGSVPATLAWAKRQVGDPYLMGGTGPNAWDCSGFMSALTHHLMGQDPIGPRLFATSTFPTSMFARGPGVFSIGSTRDAGGGIGHMAGTLGGVNVESSGGVGVHIGSSARGANDPLFGGNIWHLKQGLIKQVVAGGRGDVGAQGGLSAAERWLVAHESGGRTTANNPSSSAFGIGQLLDSNRVAYARRLGLNWHREAGDTGTTNYDAQLAMMRMYIRDRYGTARSAVNFWQQHGYYDQGGVLKPGYTLAYNGTGRDEYVSKEPPQRRSRGPVRVRLDFGAGRTLDGWIDDRIAGELDFEATAGRMGRR